MNRLLGVVVLALSLSGIGCRQVALEEVLTVTDAFTGWYYVGVVDGQNKLVPSFSFRLHNAGEDPLSRIQLLVSFWPNGADGELDSKQVTGLGAEELAPAASTEPLLVRSDAGYTLDPPQTKDDLFTHSSFRDFTVKVFARRDGRLAPLGEFPVERRIIPSAAPVTAAP
jgi:hypothetical protein